MTLLAYEEVGEGQPVVLVHAWPLSSWMWKEVAAGLGRGARVILPDLPGFGRSGRQGKPSIPGMAQEVAELLDSLHLQEPVFIGGLSMGGYVTFEFLRQFPERIRGLGLFSTRAAADTPEARRRRMENIQKIKTEGLAALMEKVMPNLLGRTTTEAKPDFVRAVKEIALASRPEGIQDALQAMAERRDSSDLLASIRCPTLVIAGDEDSLIPVAEAESFAEKIPDAELHIIKQSGHLANLEQPRAFLSLLETFLNRRTKILS